MTKLHGLEAMYATHCQQMASAGNPNPPVDLSEDTTVLRRQVEAAIGPGNDVVGRTAEVGVALQPAMG